MKRISGDITDILNQQEVSQSKINDLKKIMSQYTASSKRSGISSSSQLTIFSHISYDFGMLTKRNEGDNENKEDEEARKSTKLAVKSHFKHISSLLNLCPLKDDKINEGVEILNWLKSYSKINEGSFSILIRCLLSKKPVRCQF
jgi:hypothetical protein